jgi:N6-adenosine-specific RNA methylase IME4
VSGNESAALHGWPSGRFRTIVADPPWKQRTGSANLHIKGGGGPSRLPPYPVMSVADIAALPVSICADDDCHLYLWTTNRHLQSAYTVASAWGFPPNPGTVLVWCKPPKGRGLGESYSISTEFCLFVQRGARSANRVARNWFEWKRGRHSAKPEAFQDMVETVSPGPYIELFARRHRLGWTCWGNELDANDAADLRRKEIQ